MPPNGREPDAQSEESKFLSGRDCFERVFEFERVSRERMAMLIRSEDCETWLRDEEDGRTRFWIWEDGSGRERRRISTTSYGCSATPVGRHLPLDKKRITIIVIVKKTIIITSSSSNSTIIIIINNSLQ